MPPAVSINLCCYNSEKYLRETLDSIAVQTCKDWELVVIDDGSTDSTGNVIKEYIDRGLPIIYFYQQNHGLGYSRNEALKRSSGEYIAFIDHDDIWLPDKLELQLGVFGKHSELDFLYTNYYVTRNQTLVVKFKDKQPEGHVFEEFLDYYPVHVSTVMVRKKAFDKLNSLFNPNLHLTEEYDLFMRILYSGKAAYISKPLATYRYHHDMASVTKEIRLIKETISVVDTFKHLDQGFEKKYAGLLEKIGYRNNMALAFKLAKDELANGHTSGARQLIGPYKYFSLKVFVFFIFTCFPGSIASRLWSISLRIKSGLIL
jgi:glycosyltransferase involved in cell wall biosynthesis